MRQGIIISLVLVLTVATSLLTSRAQQKEFVCRVLEQSAARQFVPERVPLEMATIPVDRRNASAIEFPSGLRIAIAPLITTGFAQDIREKYQYVLVSEARIQFEGKCLPVGVVGLAWQGPAEDNAPTRQLAARDFSGALVHSITLQLDTSAPASPVAFTSKGETEFELRLGKYVIRGTQRKPVLS